jgi:hypothetical protein
MYVQVVTFHLDGLVLAANRLPASSGVTPTLAD